ncbi:MAG: hypothetical protein KC591_03880 [Gemmatimonadetes bacterium]|nr:hypothetical protein [Gemmatimonadota bacterium]
MRATDPEIRRRALERLAAAYWRPVYTYLRLHWREPEEEARDLAQGFFVALIERDLAARWDPSRARFRTWVRTCLDSFVADERRAAGRRKRGGGAVHVPLEAEGIEDELAGAIAPSTEDPDTFFRREWIRGLFTGSVRALRDELRAAGRETRLRLFERYDLADEADRPTYARLATEESLDIAKVGNELYAARARLRALVLERLRECTSDEAEYRAEARELFGTDEP